jgi:uncharacterized membrane protein
MSLYEYDSVNIPAAFIGLTSFVAVTIVHLWRFKQHQAWHFWGMYIGLFSM